MIINIMFIGKINMILFYFDISIMIIGKIANFFLKIFGEINMSNVTWIKKKHLNKYFINLIHR